MALKDGWQELAIQRATGGMKQLVDAVTEEAPILAMLYQNQSLMLHLQK